MHNLYRGPSIDASYQVLVYLAKRLPNELKLGRKWPPQEILVSDWLISKKSSFLLKER
jgi:hypothetical protein